MWNKADVFLFWLLSFPCEFFLFIIKYSHCCTVFPFQMSRSDQQVPLGFGSSVLTIDKVLGYEEEWRVSGQKYSSNSWRWNNTHPCSPKGFHGNPVYISFGRDTRLFLEDLKATKNAFHFYSKTDLVSTLWTLSSSAHRHIHTWTHTHTHSWKSSCIQLELGCSWESKAKSPVLFFHIVQVLTTLSF